MEKYLIIYNIINVVTFTIESLLKVKTTRGVAQRTAGVVEISI